jgi:hypothetical protein
MKPNKKLLGILMLICVPLAFFYAYNEYHRKPADLSSVKPAAVTNAASLVALYENDEQKADGMYLGKVIDITGVISEINNQQDTLVNIMLGKNNNLHRVSCLLNGKYMAKVKNLKRGDSITIRGLCTGYLMDVELNRCVLID